MPQSNGVAATLEQLVDLNDLIMKRTRAVYVPLGTDYGITVHWNPDAMDPVVYAGLQELKDQTDPFQIANLFIAPLMARWELTSAGVSNPMKKGGDDYPPTVENITALGLIIVKAIGEAINQDFGVAASPEGLKELKGASGEAS